MPFYSWLFDVFIAFINVFLQPGVGLCVLYCINTLNQWSPNFSSRGLCIDFLNLHGPKRETKKKQKSSLRFDL